MTPQSGRSEALALLQRYRVLGSNGAPKRSRLPTAEVLGIKMSSTPLQGTGVAWPLTQAFSFNHNMFLTGWQLDASCSHLHEYTENDTTCMKSFKVLNIILDNDG